MYQVDIGTEWNLKTAKGGTLSIGESVDIGTEWNLKEQEEQEEEEQEELI